MFTQPAHLAAELRHVLPARLVAAIDWRSLRVLDGTHVDEDLRSAHADVVCAVELAGRPAFVYVLVEHKSSEERFTALQLLIYMARVWQRYRSENLNAGTLPPVIPVVVHHSDRGWSGPRDLLHLVARYVPNFVFELDDLSTETAERLAQRTMSALGRLALFCLQRARHSGDLLGELRRWAGAIRTVLDAEGGGEALAAILSYIMQVTDVPPRDLIELMAKDVGSDAETTAMTTADRLREQGWAKGLKKGREEGRDEGRVEILIRQLELRFGSLSPDQLDRIRSAPRESVDLWAARVLTAAGLDEVLRD